MASNYIEREMRNLILIISMMIRYLNPWFDYILTFFVFFRIVMTERKIEAIIFYRHIEYISYSRFCLKWHIVNLIIIFIVRDTSWFSARRREIIVTQFHCKIFVMRFVDSRIQVSGMYARIHWRVTWLMYCILEITRELLFERMCCNKFFISPLRARLYRACCD